MTAETSVSFDISIRRYDGDQKEDIARNLITIEGESLQVVEGTLTTTDTSFGWEFNLSDPPVGIYVVVEHPLTLNVKVKNGDDWTDIFGVPLSRIFLYEGPIGEFRIENEAPETYETIRYKILLMR